MFEATEKMSICYQPSEISVSIVKIRKIFVNFCQIFKTNFRLKAIQKHMKDVHPDSETETEELKDLNKDILRRFEQLKQVSDFSGRATGVSGVAIATLDYRNCHIKMQ